LDIGHDRTRPGATSARGVSEFEYNLSLGQASRKGLLAAGFQGVFLVGESGTPMPLTRRTQIAGEAGATLFISLHHDSAQKQYFSEWSPGGRSLPYSDKFHGYSVFVSGASMWARESLAVATLLARALRARGLTPSLHHAEPIQGENRQLLDAALGIYRFDELAILRTATMPALLLESAVIVNRNEEQEIQSGQYHPKVVAALVEAISRHCAAMSR
jgi:N-acetylmuramoyl-L-alanine amidase